MAQNTPFSTYLTKRFPVMGGYWNDLLPSRSDDPHLINLFPQVNQDNVTGEKRYVLYSRPGLSTYTTYPITATNSSRGLYYWAATGKIYGATGNKLYSQNTTTFVLSTVATLSNSSGAVGFYEFTDATNQKFLIVLDGISGWIISAASPLTSTQITSVNFPTPHQTKAAVLDGYLFVAKSGTADIYNSNVDDPTTWTAGDFISAEAYGDNIQGLVRLGNYVVAIGEQSIEYFYDAGTSPGTPLARNPSGLHQVGTSAPNTICQIEDQVIFIGQTSSGGRSIWMLENLSIREIGTASVYRQFEYAGITSSTTAVMFRVSGHKFYMFHIQGTSMVYDFLSDMWMEWQATGSGSMPFNYSCDVPAGTGLGGLGSVTMAMDINGKTLLTLSTGSTSDGGSSPGTFTSSVDTPVVDFDSASSKFMHRMSVLITTPVSSSGTIHILWSDDEGATWVAGPTQNITSTAVAFNQLGRFRRRVFKISITAFEPIRLGGFEFCINMGTR